MALSGNSSTNANTTINKSRNYKLCCVCTFRGKKGHSLVICTTCLKNVHSSNSCSTTINTSLNTNLNKKNTDSKSDIINGIQYLCTTCKLKRKSIQPPTTKRSTHSSTVTSGCKSASQGTSPSHDNQDTFRRSVEGNSSHISNKSKHSESIGLIPSHTELQRQIDEINKCLNELKLLCTNNNTIINHLKFENQRLTELVYSMQNSASMTSGLPTTVNKF